MHHAEEADAPHRRRSVLRLAIALIVLCLLALVRVVTKGEPEVYEEALKADVKDCILLFGAFCNGNMGDVVQPISMERLLSSAASTEQCFYYAHPVGEKLSRGFSIGEFFGDNTDRSRLISLSPRSAWKVNRFKAFVIGGGGIFTAKHSPLFEDKFEEAVTVPIVIMGVGAGQAAKLSTTLLSKTAFVSGRDPTSIERLADILSKDAAPAVQSDDVHLVRDPVLSDKAFTDTNGTCWKQSSGDHQAPLCFVLPAANSVGTMEMHWQFRDEVVHQGDRFINVFPKHQASLSQFLYPGTVEEIVDPMEYVKQLCSCKAIISTRFHGAILGLHMGVPTFGAFRVAANNKVPDLMIETMSLPDQFFVVDSNLTREVVDRQVDIVRHSYENGGRRGAIHGRLSDFHGLFQVHARHMLSDVVGVSRREPEQQDVEFSKGELPKEAKEEQGLVDYVIAICLLITIAEIAFMPSTAGGGGRGARLQPCETAALNGDHIPASIDGQRASVGRSLLQKEVDARIGTSIERGVLPERSATTAFEPSPPRRVLLRISGAQSMSKPSDLLFVLNFVLWIALAVGFSSYSKSYLRETHDPVGLLALQGVSGSLVLTILRRLGVGASDVSNPGDASRKIHGLRGLQIRLTTMASRRETVVAVLHSGQAFLTNFSLLVGGVAVTNALKAMEPVAAAVFSYFLLGKRVAPGGVTALSIIVAGILLLTFKGAGSGGEAKDSGGGDGLNSSRILVSAAFTMVAVSCNALRNVVIKKGDPIPPHRTLFTCSVAAGAIGVTVMLLRGVIRSMDALFGGGNGVAEVARYGSWLSVDGVNAALCFVGYNFASFNLLARLSPVGHAVGNSVKRVVMFGSGILLMGEVMTVRQLTGAAVALVGVGVYNVAGKRK